MLSLDKILLILKDGNWHSIQALSENINIPQNKLTHIIDFLTEFDFIQLDDTQKKAKLQKPLFKFINELARLEQETT
jgi:predicted transcriptional regulator